MKLFYTLILLATVLSFGSLGQADEPVNNGYRCKYKNANDVCAQKLSTGQCTHVWSQNDFNNPMFHCKKFIGVKKSSFNKKNYYCRSQGNKVCAASKQTNQCTHSWTYSGGEDAMFRCEKFLGIVKTSFDKSNFRCKKTASAVCAQSLVTGQCTHRWTKSQYSNPMRMCKNWLKK